MTERSDKGCTLCPLACGADRALSPGVCGVGGARGIGERDPYETAFVARAARHFYEEPPISGVSGSGAIFFSGCNMACVFCQNIDISASVKGRPIDAEELCGIMLRLEELGSHNINLVTPAPHVRMLLKAIPLARERGLKIPIVYNTNAYETVEAIKSLNGLIDIYLPDLKYAGRIAAGRYSGREDYFNYASRAVEEMYAQCGELVADDNGIAQRGVIIRHLVLPGSVDETRGVLDYIASAFPLSINISLMSQYTPIEGMRPPLDRRLMKREYDRAVDYALYLGFTNLLLQERSSAEGGFTPEFSGYFE